MTSFGQKALDYVTHICKAYGPRGTGSEAEKRGADDLAKELKKYSKDIIYDTFPIYPDLYPQGLIKIGVISVIIGALSLYLQFPFNILAIIAPIFALFDIFFSLIKLKTWFGIFFKKQTSQNVFGKIPPKENVNKPKMRILIGGHMDAAISMKITKYGDKMPLITFGGIGYGILALIFWIIKTPLVAYGPKSFVLYSGPVFLITYIDVIYMILSCIGLPLLVILYNGYTGKTVVHGANDNLAGVGIAVVLADFFAQPQNQLKNIELFVGTFGAEEIGDRGSHAFVEKYGPTGILDNMVAIIPESCAGGTNLAVLAQEKMHLAKHDPQVCQEVQNAYDSYRASLPADEQAKIFPCEIKVLPFAASDAGSFSLKGYKATAILGYEGSIMKPANWHQESDIPENLNPKMMDVVIHMILEYIQKKDQELSS